MTKEQFLANLEKALTRLICDQVEKTTDPAARSRTAGAVAEFVRENAAEYELEDLVATFSSAQNAIGLFYEFQEAKGLCQPDSLPAHRQATGDGAACQAPLRRGGDLWEEPVTGMVFVWVPGGSFLMGSGDWDDQGAADEKPVHEVWLNGFWMGKCPVTVDQYLVFAKAVPTHAPHGIRPSGPFLLDGRCQGCGGSIGNRPVGGDWPVVGVSWHDAMAFAKWLSDKSGTFFRLPTEAEWEFAARSGGRPEKFPGGLPPEATAWYQANSAGTPHPVGQLRPNGAGLYDLSGNVCEWCLDVYHRQAYERHGQLNPVFTGEGTCRVVRGGSFCYGAKDIRCADRGLAVPEHREGDLGFRLVRPA